MDQPDATRSVFGRGTNVRGTGNRLGTEHPAAQVVNFEKGSTIYGRRPRQHVAQPSHSEQPATQIPAAPVQPQRAPSPSPSAPEESARATPSTKAKNTGQPPKLVAPPTAKSPARAPAPPPVTASRESALRRIVDDIILEHDEDERLFVGSTVETAAKVILSELRGLSPRLEKASLDRMLDMLSRHPQSYIFFARMTRDPELSDYLLEAGLDWDRFSEADPPSPQDWAMISTGLIAGAAEASLEDNLQTLLLPKDIVYAIYVTIGRYWDPELDKNFRDFTGSLKQLLRHPYITGSAIYREDAKQIKELWSRRRYDQAAFRLGKIALGVAFALRDIKHLGQGAITVAKNLPKMTIATVQKLNLLRELARFYLKTSVGLLEDGTVLKNFEDSMIMVRPGGKSFRLDLKDLPPEDVKRWQAVLDEEQRAASALKPPEALSGNPLGTGARATRPSERLAEDASRDIEAHGNASTHGADAARDAPRAGPSERGTGHPGVGQKATGSEHGSAPTASDQGIQATATGSLPPRILLRPDQIEHIGDLVAEAEILQMGSYDPSKTVVIRDGEAREIYSGTGDKKRPGYLWEPAAPNGLSEAEYYVREFESLSGQHPRNGGSLDNNVNGSYFATHSEVKDRIQQFAEGTNKTAAVSHDMCPSCRGFFREVARRKNMTMTVGDIHHTRVFHPDGSVDIYRTGGELIETIPRGQKISSTPSNYVAIPW